MRVSELVRLRWDQVDFEQEDIFIRRVKGSESKSHPMIEGDAQALRRLAGDEPTGWVFKTSRKGKSGHVSESGFFKILARAGAKAELNFPVHPHMLRHGCGHWMNKQGQTTRTIQSWLGHIGIQNTVRYTALDADHFRKAGMGAAKGKRKKSKPTT